ncbi:hypothetical protein BJY59DRAFT_685235 [Rhodotorula toruloides]
MCQSLLRCLQAIQAGRGPRRHSSRLGSPVGSRSLTSTLHTLAHNAQTRLPGLITCVKSAALPSGGAGCRSAKAPTGPAARCATPAPHAARARTLASTISGNKSRRRHRSDRAEKQGLRREEEEGRGRMGRVGWKCQGRRGLDVLERATGSPPSPSLQRLSTPAPYSHSLDRSSGYGTEPED